MTPANIDESCPDGWQGHGEFCYLKLSENSTIQASRTECRQIESDLVSIHNDAENDVVSHLCAPDTLCWIGLYLEDILGVVDIDDYWLDNSEMDYTRLKNDFLMTECSVIENSDEGDNDTYSQHLLYILRGGYLVEMQINI